MELKTCFKCRRELPLTEFYRHKQMADGRLGKCRDCTRADVAQHRAEHVDAARAYDQKRSVEPARRALSVKVQREWRAAHPDRVRAQRLARRLARVGPDLCEGCNLPLPLEQHHPDYARPLLVMWLCKPCHAVADKVRRRMEAVTVVCADCGRTFFAPPEAHDVLCQDCAPLVHADDEPGEDPRDVPGTRSYLRQLWSEKYE